MTPIDNLSRLPPPTAALNRGDADSDIGSSSRRTQPDRLPALASGAALLPRAPQVPGTAHADAGTMSPPDSSRRIQFPGLDSARRSVDGQSSRASIASFDIGHSSRRIQPGRSSSARLSDLAHVESEATLIPGGSRRIEAYGSASEIWSMEGQLSRQSSMANVADRQPHVTVSIAAPLIATPTEEARERLDRFEFPAEVVADPARLAEQTALQEHYVAWIAEHVVAPRRAAFGEGAYRLAGDMEAIGRGAALPAAYQFVRQFLSSSSRSPVRNALTTKFAPHTDSAGGIAQGELFTNNYDPAVIGGVAGGMTAYAMDVVLTALDRRSRLSNMPQLKPVDVKVLVPDPGPVLLTVREGRKSFAPIDAPTRLRLQSEVKVRRDHHAQWQATLSGQAAGVLWQPLFAGAINALRRRTAPNDAVLTQATQVFVGSIWASGTAGALARGSLEVLKGTPWVSQGKVDDYAGGRQTMNLFALKKTDETQPAPGVRDLTRLPMFVGEVLMETGALVKHSLDLRNRPFTEVAQQAMDVVRHGFSNIIASVGSPGVGTILAQIERGPSNGPLPGESLRSSAYTLQQFGQSGMNDFFWQASRDLSRGAAYNLAASLDSRRDVLASTLSQQANESAGRLPLLAHALADLPAADEALPHEALQVLQALRPGESLSLPALRQAHDAVAAYRPGAEAAQQARSTLLRGLAETMEPLARQADLEAWRRPRPAAA